MRREVDGVFLLDKPAGISSNAALQAAKRMFGAKKAGHAGTLDPLATGLLPVLFGEASKFADRLLDADKEYLASVRLGASTTTGDAEGEVIDRRPVNVTHADLQRAIDRFKGEIEQVPPMYSALKRQGTPLYKLARRGIEVERAPRTVQVRALDLLRREGESVDLRVLCSKGTYVRTLAADIGCALGTGAYLAGLRRTATAGFRIEAATTLAELERMSPAERDGRLLPLDLLLSALPALRLDAAGALRFRHGQPLRLEPGQPEGKKRIYDAVGGLIGVGTLAEDGELRVVRLLADRTDTAQAAEKHQKNL